VRRCFAFHGLLRLKLPFPLPNNTEVVAR